MQAAMLEAGYSQHVLFSFQRAEPWREGESDNAAAGSKLAFSLGYKRDGATEMKASRCWRQ